MALAGTALSFELVSGEKRKHSQGIIIMILVAPVRRL